MRNNDETKLSGRIFNIVCMFGKKKKSRTWRYTRNQQIHNQDDVAATLVSYTSGTPLCPVSKQAHGMVRPPITRLDLEPSLGEYAYVCDREIEILYYY